MSAVVLSTDTVVVNLNFVLLSVTRVSVGDSVDSTNFSNLICTINFLLLLVKAFIHRNNVEIVALSPTWVQKLLVFLSVESTHFFDMTSARLALVARSFVSFFDVHMSQVTFVQISLSISATKRFNLVIATSSFYVVSMEIERGKEGE